MEPSEMKRVSALYTTQHKGQVVDAPVIATARSEELRRRGVGKKKCRVLPGAVKNKNKSGGVQVLVWKGGGERRALVWGILIRTVRRAVLGDERGGLGAHRVCRYE